MIARLSQGQFIALLSLLTLLCVGSALTWSQPKMGYYDWTDAETDCRADGIAEGEALDACVGSAIRLNFWVRLGQWFMRYLGIMLFPATLWVIASRQRGVRMTEAPRE